MAKRSSSRYSEGGRGRDWLKIKTHGRQEFAICGYTKGQGRRSGSFGALVLGVRRGRTWEWVGNVGTGFGEREIGELLAQLEPLRRDESPFQVVPKMPKVRKGDVVWVEPTLVAEVEFAEWTHDGHLRAPVVPGTAHGQGGGGRAARAACGGDRGQGEALQPRQGLLAGRGHHEGRPHRLLPRGRGRARAASARPAVHDAALSRRRLRQGVLPEGRPEGHARVDPALPRAGLDARAAAEAAVDRRAGRERRGRAASGWRTWAAST